ncbi:hypothetical protein GCM10010116_49660 [Microbispora rosea subsp. aerata]|nr:hypothetical protein GCM10010116_49660 [Microbispora rosea subsp. aerata]GIH58082.1 hypothetical protein Mro02_49960 [Microbispora rosea subsp. aerata]GLJ82361.1 hypothetical protein GCM10017588_10860 [Microbispora rosea subsp. aerata]
MERPEGARSSVGSDSVEATLAVEAHAGVTAAAGPRAPSGDAGAGPGGSRAEAGGT